MLRSVTAKATAGRILGGRAFGTSAQKRALNAQQLKGAPSAASAKPESPPVAPVKASGGGGIGPVFAVLVATGGVGAAYYNGILDEYIGPTESPPVVKEPEVEQPPQTVEKTVVQEETVESVEEVVLTTNELDEVNEIIADVIGEAAMEVVKEEASVEVAPVTEVMNDIANAENEVAAVVVEETPPVTTAEEETTVEPEVSMVETLVESVASSTVPVFAASALDEAKILAEIDQLKQKLHEKSDEALTEAHTELAKLSSLDMMSIDLDGMTNSQLKVRLVQMAKELEERTKWEAVRLQEFLVMKEKEVEDKYVLLIKKLRLEAELLQEEKLTEQRKALTAQAEEALSEQQTRADAFLENSMQIQEKAHAEDKAAFEKMTEEAVGAKYEELFGKELAKIKENFATKMTHRVKQMEQLSKKLQDLETSLKVSQDFQVGSLEAHRITAAAIALMEKLESGEPAGAAVNALKAVASENAVVSAAVQSLPNAVTESGISTVQELQAGFEEKIYPQCRKAANIPHGQGGLEGQLLGSIFAALRPAPGPDDAAPESEKDAPEYVLSRIRRYVQLGELEKALLETKKLGGQVAFTAKDWESQAKDRVAVEKALKVIRMECALANENLGKAAAA